MAVATAPYVFKRSNSAFRGPDPGIVKDQLKVLQMYLHALGTEEFMRWFFWILRKKPQKGDKVNAAHWNKRLVPFEINEIQRDINNTMPNRTICLKARQIGYTTFYIIRRLCLPAFTEPGIGCLLVSQNNEYAGKHFEIVKRAYKHFGDADPSDITRNQFARDLHQHLLHFTYSNRKELVLDQLDSRIMCGSAETPEVGQGITLHHACADEYSRWPGNPEETLSNFSEAIVDDGTLDIFCTANGMGGAFWDECQRAKAGKSQFKYYFHEWWHQQEYRVSPAVDKDSLDEKERLLVEKVGLDLNQIAFRRKKMVALRNQFPEKYPEDDISCFLLTGSAFFENEVLITRKLELNANPPKFADSLHGGVCKILKPRIKNRQYIIGADVAIGRQVRENETDNSAAVVIDKLTGEEVAWYCAKIAPEDYGLDLVDLAKYYNDALIAVERNEGGGGGTVILSIKGEGRYWNVYKHKDWWKRERKIVEIEGFPTNIRTRPIALNRLGKFVREHPEYIYDVDFIDEALAFVRNEKGKPEATQGAKDDRVICRAVAQSVRLVELGYLDFLDPALTGEKYGKMDDDAE